MSTKLCSKCKKNKTLSEFYKDKQKKDGYCSICKKCQYLYYKKTYKKRYECARSCELKRKYNLTLKEYNIMFEEQKGLCAICKEPSIGRMLSVDHNHKTGQIRKLLCIRCNTLVGHFESRYDLVSKILKYLKEN